MTALFLIFLILLKLIAENSTIKKSWSWNCAWIFLSIWSRKFEGSKTYLFWTEVIFNLGVSVIKWNLCPNWKRAANNWKCFWKSKPKWTMESERSEANLVLRKLIGTWSEKRFGLLSWMKLPPSFFFRLKIRSCFTTYLCFRLTVNLINNAMATTDFMLIKTAHNHEVIIEIPTNPHSEMFVLKSSSNSKCQLLVHLKGFLISLLKEGEFNSAGF